MRSSNTLRLLLSVLVAACGGKTFVDEGTGGAAGSGSSSASMGNTASGTTSSGGGANFAACSAPGTCVLVNKDCCGVCGRPTLADRDAVNESAVAAHAKAVCPDPDVVCPACAEELNPNLFAYCDLAASECRGANLPDTTYAKCSQDSDCSLRLGLGCCTCGAGGEWVAVSTSRLGELEALLCKEGTACAECEPQPPLGITARCVAGACAVTVVGPG